MRVHLPIVKTATGRRWKRGKRASVRGTCVQSRARHLETVVKCEFLCEFRYITPYGLRLCGLSNSMSGSSGGTFIEMLLQSRSAVAWQCRARPWRGLQVVATESPSPAPTQYGYGSLFCRKWEKSARKLHTSHYFISHPRANTTVVTTVSSGGARPASCNAS